VETGLTGHLLHAPQTTARSGVQALKRIQPVSGFASLLYDDHIGKAFAGGAGCVAPGCVCHLLQGLPETGVNIEMISTSEIRVSVITRDDQLDEACARCHGVWS